MSYKIIALGNVLMKDDGIGCEILKRIENELRKEKSTNDFEFVYGETDISFCINSVIQGDYLFILDASYLNKKPGDITMIPINSLNSHKKTYSQHSYNFLDLLKLYYPDIKGYIYAIEINEINYGIGLSDILKNSLEDITSRVKESILSVKIDRSKEA